MGCALPCISTDFRSGVSELLATHLSPCEQILSGVCEHGFGILISVCDGNQYSRRCPLTEEELYMAEGIQRVLQDKNLQERYRKNSERIVEKLDITYMTKSWMEVINENIDDYTKIGRRRGRKSSL